MNQGTQVAYVPTHAQGNLKHDDKEMTTTVLEGKRKFLVEYWTLSDGCVARVVEAFDYHDAERIAVEQDECFCQLKFVTLLPESVSTGDLHA